MGYTDFDCPLCGDILCFEGSELVCRNEDCRYDKTLDEIITEYCEMKNYNRRD